MHRRLLLLAMLLLLDSCTRIASRSDSAQALLQQAIDAAGGEAALTRARVLTWSGEATAFAGDNKIELGVESRVAPFHSAQSDTWLRDQGRSTLRSLQIDGDQGWMVRDGQRSPMPARMLRHEQSQYAVYGLMRLVTLRDQGVVLRLLAVDSEGRRGLHEQHPSAPDTDMFFNSDGRLAYLVDSVPAADGEGTVSQRFEFDGSIESGGVRWPHILRINQNGKPFFELRLQQFRPEPCTTRYRSCFHWRDASLKSSADPAAIRKDR
jgi:hypothetical protein